MASEQQLREYAESLHPIYREILTAFSRLEPNRKRGFGLAFQTLAVDLADRLKDVGLSEVIGACNELAKNELFEVKNGMFVHPTPLGEQLITIVTGKKAPEVKVPKLPPVPK